MVQEGKRQIKICWTNKFVCMSNLRMLHTRTHTGRHNSCGININYSYLLRHRGVQFTLWSVAWSAVVSHATAKFSTIQFWNWRRDWNCELDTKTGSGNSVWLCVCLNLPIVDGQTHLSEMAKSPGLLLDRGGHKLNQHTH